MQIVTNRGDTYCRVSSYVCKGRGIASTVRKNDVHRLSEIFKRNFIRGSLNLVSKNPIWLIPDKNVYMGEGGALYWEGVLNGKLILISRWLHCPAHVFEIYSDEYLRDGLDCSEGDILDLDIPIEVVSHGSMLIKNKISWFLTWYGREFSYYQNDSYAKLVTSKIVGSISWRSFQPLR